MIPGAARLALAPGYLLPRLRRYPLARVGRSPLATFCRACGARFWPALRRSLSLPAACAALGAFGHLCERWPLL